MKIDIPNLEVSAYGKKKPLCIFLEDVLNLPEEDVKDIFSKLYEQTLQEGLWDKKEED